MLPTLSTPCYLVSDAHLGVSTPDVERHLLRFLEQLEGRAGSLIINGDLYEFWFEWRSVIPRTGYRVLASLARLREHGVPILWIAGNHDCWGGDVLRNDVGVEYVVGSWQGQIGSWRTKIDHGDGLREREDRPYRRLRAVLRHPWAIRAYRWLHPDLGTRLALGSSGASRNYRARDGGAGLLAVAQAQLAADPEIDLLVFGHSHVPALSPAPGGGVYANAGAWMDDTTYILIEPDSVALCRFAGTGSGERLADASWRARTGRNAGATSEA